MRAAGTPSPAVTAPIVSAACRLLTGSGADAAKTDETPEVAGYLADGVGEGAGKRGGEEDDESELHGGLR